MGPLAEGDSLVGAGCVWRLEYFPRELHALFPKWFYHLALEQVEHVFYLRPTEAAPVRWERRVTVAHEGGALDELPPLALFRVV